MPFTTLFVPAMSLPVPPAFALGAVRASGQIASQLIQTVGQTGSSFAKILSDETAAESGEVSDTKAESGSMTEPTAAESLASVRQAIGKFLNELGLSPGDQVELQLSPSGKVQVDSNHPRAAEIEGRLKEQPHLLAAVRQQLARQPDFKLTIEAETSVALTDGPHLSE